jgi:tRNA 5-methylaminomethyl-2-thiouridine biosynthesis bifunctional protein
VKTEPIRPAQIDFSSGVPAAPAFGDVYHPRVGALAQARHVFLQGNGLPARWRGRRRFVIVETGFGLGNNFLATWHAWREDAQRCERLVFVSVERHPPSLDDLRRAHADSALPALAGALAEAWPPLTPNLHALHFDAGRVTLLLALGDVATVLPALRVVADAYYLDGFAPARNPQMWQPRVLKALGRMAAPGATLATWSAARELRAGLTSAGFEVHRASGVGGKRDITLAHFAPRFEPLALPSGAVPGAAEAVVIGAGLAGAFAAEALAQAGLAVTVLDRQAAPAQETSGNPGGLFHGTVNADDGPYARLFRATALHAQRRYTRALAAGVPGAVQGLLRLDERPEGVPGMNELLARQGLPTAYVQALPASEASALAGVPLPQPAWFYPGGGWMAPAPLVAHALAHDAIRFVGHATVAGLRRVGELWQVLDPAGKVVAAAPIVVLAHAASAGPLLQTLGHAAWPLGHTRGQVTHWAGATPLRRPVAGDGYAVPLAGGLLCGATREAGVPGDDSLRISDHQLNIERLQRLCGIVAPGDAALWQGRTGWRLHADDRLPIAGAVPLALWPAGTRADQARLLPRDRGLFVLTALGARGLTLAPLLGQLVAAQATGMPWPLEQDLADAVDPGRWRVRAARAGSQPA